MSEMVPCKLHCGLCHALQLRRLDEVRCCHDVGLRAARPLRRALLRWRTHTTRLWVRRELAALPPPCVRLTFAHLRRRAAPRAMIRVCLLAWRRRELHRALLALRGRVGESRDAAAAVGRARHVVRVWQRRDVAAAFNAWVELLELRAAFSSTLRRAACIATS